MIKKIFALICLLGLIPLVHSAPDAETQQKIDEAVQQLGDSKFRVRRAASQYLWDLMDEALPSLEKAASSDDPEVAIRAKELIEKIDSGIVPGMSDQIAEQIEIFRTTRSASTKYRIAANLFEEEKGPRILRNLLQKEKNEFTRNNVISMILQPLYEKTAIAILNDDHEEVDLLLGIDLMTESDRALRNVATYEFLHGTADQRIALLDKMESPGKSDLMLKMYLHRCKGDFPNAIETARAIENKVLIREILIEAAAWTELAEMFEEQVVEDEVEWLGYRASFNRLAGNEEVYKACIEQLMKIGREDDGEVEFVAEILLLNDEHEKATTLYVEQKKYFEAAKLLDVQMRFAELLKVIKQDENPQDPDYYASTRKKILQGALMNEGEEDYTPPPGLRDGDTPLAKILDTGLDTAEIKKWERAAAIFAEGMQEEPSSPLPCYFYGWALQHAGKAEEGQVFIDRATMMPLAIEQSRFALTMLLEEAGQYIDASMQRAIQLASGTFGSRISGEALTSFGVTDNLLRKKYDRAIYFAERSRLQFIDKESYLIEPQYYMLRGGQIMQMQVLKHHAKGNAEKAAEYAQAFSKMLPNSSMEFAVELKELGADKAYRAAFDTSFAHLSDLCRTYPKAAETHNALAWQTAICREKLDEGLRLATIATGLFPESPEYLDTLAEVHFQLKNDETAIEMMKKCIPRDPENEYYSRQLKRFEAGDRESPAQ